MKTAISALALATALFAGAANAADLPSHKAPPPYIPPPPIMTWTGFYAGLNLGGGFYASNSSNQGWNWGWNNGNNSTGGVIGGGQIGYNFQVTPMFVVGAETDFQGTSLGSGGGNNNNWGWLFGLPGGGGATARLNWFGTVRGRVGITLLSPKLLVYGTGGFAYGQVQRNGWLNQNSAVQTGWTAGGGAEWMFLPNWSAKGEYLFTDLNSGGAQSVLAATPTDRRHTQYNVVRAGVNYHFNLGGAPSATSY